MPTSNRSRPEGLEPTSRDMPRVRDGAEELYLVAYLPGGLRIVRVPAHASLTIGRAVDCELTIEEPKLSRKHFSIRGRPAVLTDLGSANGTRAGGLQLQPHDSQPIEVGHLIEAGGILFTLHDRDPRAELTARASPASALSTTQAATAGFVVEDPAMTRIHQLIGMVARSTMPVLVVGETGVGKELVSTAVHARSLRIDRRLVRINCAALPDTLLESELFGFERGAFTGAAQGKKGLIESADGGSFLLDEIGEMPLTTQAKLLRVLESGEITRLGALQPRSVDVRFIAATNRDLPALVAEGRFRRDLYYRLAGMTIHIPPLRERRVEIAQLAELFLTTRCAEARVTLSREALTILEQHSWPGNVRELRNVIDRAATICSGGTIRPEHLLLDPIIADAASTLSPTARPPAAAEELAGSPARGQLLRIDPETERELIVQALARAGGNQGRAAAALGISRRTLLTRLDRYGVTRPRKKVPS